jgi:2-polyprenyl-6-hydroxyphenyl methylase/3-demethylubiquinone-9 3-methyltransferase
VQGGGKNQETSSVVKLEINNQIYSDLGCGWWDENGDGNLVSLRYLTNPAKFNYINNVIKSYGKCPKKISVLEVGCGGGYLADKLAKAGFEVTGLDPSNNSIKAAKVHAKQENLTIKFVEGFGEKLPFKSNSFHFVCCCDVLEHVKDFTLVIKEISRVLRRGGVFFYDTINRTTISKIVMIKVMQGWEGISFLGPNIHIWDMFIKPKELIEVLSHYNLVNQEIKGLSPSMNFISHFFSLRARNKGQISWQELGKRFNLKISSNISCNYIGYAVKSNNSF